MIKNSYCTGERSKDIQQEKVPISTVSNANKIVQSQVLRDGNAKGRNEQVDQLFSSDERKRPYNSMVEIKAPNEEEMEAYYLKRKREEDPMAYF